MTSKVYLSAESLLTDSFRLGVKVYQSGFRPNFIIGVWRGGTPVGIAVQEVLDYIGIKADHIAIRTSSYYGIGQKTKEVKVHGLEYIVRYANWDNSLLIVDDVFDSGGSIKAILEALKRQMRRNLPADIRIATPWFKPGNNKTEIIPDYYLHETADWLVYPHELDGLTKTEIFQNKPGLEEIFKEAGLA